MISSPEPDEPLFQFNTINPQTNKTLTTVAKIRTRRDRKTATNLLVLADREDFFDRDVLDSDRNLGMDRTGFDGMGSLCGIASEFVEFGARDSAAGSFATKVTGSVVGVSFDSAAAEIEDNTAAEHHSGSISKFDSASDTASSHRDEDVS